MQTINELETSAQAGLEALRDLELKSEAAVALELLLPEGLTPVVELVSENGRRKRGSAAAWNWNPQSDRIVISFKVTNGNYAAGEVATPAPPSSPPPPKETREHPGQGLEMPQALPPTEALSDIVSAQEIIECCQALASAERSNRQFIALKWFRDDFLATVDYAWTRSPQRRQRVLSQAIDIGRIEARKINNPKAPQFPTTTITLNRSIPTPGVPPRFQPVTIRGESASKTLLRDRGNV